MRSDRLIATVGTLDHDGFSLACTADLDVPEAARRLEAELVADPETDDVLTMAATAVPGGVVLFQPWSYGATMPGVLSALSVNTTCYGMYANPKSGNQGAIIADGVVVGWDLHPGGGSEDEDSLEHRYEFHPVAYCFAYVDLAPTDARSLTGPYDAWLRLPDRDYWSL